MVFIMIEQGGIKLMKDIFVNLEKLGLPIFFISDEQEWEAIKEIDFKENDLVEYCILDNLVNEKYILITSKLNEA